MASARTDRWRKGLWFASTAAALTLAPVVTRAETVAADGGDATARRGDLEDIVVTASRRRGTALDTPITISVASSDDLMKGGITDYSKLSQVVPGLVYSSNSVRNGGATNSFILHGLNLDAVSSSGDIPLPTFPPVSVYVDETPVFVNLRLADVQRVEVLRGPQATLYGNASIAGTVRVLFNPPDLTKISASISGSAGWTEHADGPNASSDAVINYPVSSRFGLRLAAGYDFEHGFIDAPRMVKLDANGFPVLAQPNDVVHSLPVPVGKKDIDDAGSFYVRPMALFEDGPLRLLATYQHQHEHADGDSVDSYPGGVTPTAYSSALDPGFQNDNFDSVFVPKFGKYQSGIFLDQPYQRDVDVGSLEASYDLGFATLTSVTSAYDNKSDAVVDFSGTYQRLLGYLYLGFPRLVAHGSRKAADRAITEEVRLVSALGHRINYTIGGFFTKQRSQVTWRDVFPGYADYEAALGVPSTGTDLAAIYQRRMRFADLALFGELGFDVTRKWQITAGARVYRQKLNTSTLTELPICGVFCSTDGVDPLGVTFAANGTTITKALFKLSTSYKPTPNLLAYFTFSQGTRRGGANGVPTQGPFAESPAFLFFKPDSVNNFELGLKGRIGPHFEFTSAVYYIDWRHPQVSITTPVGAFPAAVNGKKARSYGVDLDARLKLSDAWSFNATYSFNRSELLAPVIVGGTSYGFDGARLPGTPHHAASVGTNYSRPVGGALSFTAHADTSWRSGISTALSPRDNVDLPGFDILNASIGLEGKGWRAMLFGDNITESRGVLSAVSTDRTDIRTVNNRVSRPRTVGLRLSYDLD